MRFVLLVEGDTEKDSLGDFFKRWLDQELKRKSKPAIGIHVRRLRGYSQFLKDIVEHARAHLDGVDNREIVAVLGLMDLAGTSAFFPRGKSSVKERYAWGVRHIESRVARGARFRMFFAVHECEAWLLSDPTIFPPKLRAVLHSFQSNQEGVDFGQYPSRLLNRLYLKHLKREYKKRTYGADLFAKLNPKTAAGKCPYLRSMLREMLKMAMAALP
jgi:hypothetical protein